MRLFDMTLRGLLAVALLGASLSAQQNTFSAASATAEQRLEEALQAYNALQERRNQERPELAARLEMLEEEVERLRADNREAQRIQSVAGSDIARIQDQTREQETVNSYIRSTLLNEYFRRLQTGLNPAERKAYETQLTEALNMVDNQSEFTAQEIFGQQLQTLETAIARIEDRIGGALTQGTASDGDLILEGQFAILGPTAYFASDDGTLAGIVAGEASGNPQIEALPNFAAGIVAATSNSEGVLPVDTTAGEAIEGARRDLSLIEEIQAGGFVMWAIIPLFILAILIAIFKAVQLFTTKAGRQRDVDIILDHLREGDEAKALSHAKGIGGPTGDMLIAGVEHVEEDREVIEEILYEKIITTQPKLERFLAVISVAAATAPLLGLLGTVTGMIKTFTVITIVGTGDAGNLAGGISEALITTKWGLIVAIPTLFMHALLNRKAKGVIASMEQTAVSYINGVVELRERQEPTTEAA